MKFLRHVSGVLLILHNVLIGYIPPIERERFRELQRKPLEPFETCRSAQRVLLKPGCNENELRHIGQTLSPLLRRDPGEVYAIALSVLRVSRKPLPLPVEIAKGVEDVVRSAAHLTLRYPPLVSRPTGMGSEQDDYIRLTDYRLACQLRLTQFLLTGELMESTGGDWVWYKPRCGVCVVGAQHSTAWWMMYLRKVAVIIGEFPCEEAFEDKYCIWETEMKDLKTKCRMCYRMATNEYPDFKEKLLKAVAEVLDSVRIPFVD